MRIRDGGKVHHVSGQCQKGACKEEKTAKSEGKGGRRAVGLNSIQLEKKRTREYDFPATGKLGNQE